MHKGYKLCSSLKNYYKEIWLWPDPMKPLTVAIKIKHINCSQTQKIYYISWNGHLKIQNCIQHENNGPPQFLMQMFLMSDIKREMVAVSTRVFIVLSLDIQNIFP